MNPLDIGPPDSPPDPPDRPEVERRCSHGEWVYRYRDTEGVTRWYHPDDRPCS